MDVWEAALTHRPTGQVGLMLPSELGRALRAEGYNRVRIEVTGEGILLTPYVAESERVLALPSWSRQREAS